MEDSSVIDVAIECLLAGISDRDPEEWHHCRRVEKLCAITAKEMEWGPDEIADLKLAALLHHMDRSRIPESALSPRVAAFLSEFGRETQKADGRQGKPSSRRAQGAGIIALADTFDRLTSAQRYRRPLSTDDALAILRYDAGKAFGEAAVEAFCHAQSRESVAPKAKAA